MSARVVTAVITAFQVFLLAVCAVLAMVYMTGCKVAHQVWCCS